MFPVGVKTPVEGSNTSAVEYVVPPRSSPPVTRTLPSPSNVAVWNTRMTLIFPVEANPPAAVSYNSADASALNIRQFGCRGGGQNPINFAQCIPPATSTFPSLSNVALCASRVVDILPVGVKPDAGARTSIDGEVPVMEAVTVSVAVMLWLPLVLSVTEKVPTPFVSVEFAGSKAWPSVLVKPTVPE